MNVNSGGLLGGTGSVDAVVLNTGGGLAPGNSVGTLTVNNLTLNSAFSTNVWEFNLSNAQTNDQIIVLNAGGLTNSFGSGFNLVAEGTATPWSTDGIYDLIQYNGGYTGGLTGLAVVDPQAGKTYAFGATGSWITLTIGDLLANAMWNGGGGDDLWSTSANWGGHFPVATNQLIFTGLNRLNNTNDWGAASNLFAGIVFSNDAGAFLLNGNAVTLAGDVVNYSSQAQTFNLDLVLTNGGGTFNAANGDLLVNSLISETGGAQALTKMGSGALTLAQANTFSGGVTLNTGTLNLNHAQALGTGTFTINGGALDNTSGAPLTLNNNAMHWNGDFGFTGTTNLDLGTGAVTLGNNRSVTVAANTLTVGGVIDDGVHTYSLTKAGAGTLVLAGANTYHGDTTNSAGTLSLANALALQNSSLVMAGGASVFDSAAGTAFTLGGLAAASAGAGYDLALTNSAGAAVALTVGGNNQSTAYAGVLSGNGGSLSKTGAGTLTLAGANTYAGGTIINQGTLAVSADNNLGASGGQLTINAGTLAVAGSFDSARQIAVSNSAAAISVGPGFAYTNSTPIIGPGGLTKTGAGTLDLAGANSYAGNTLINAGTLALSGSGTLGAGKASIGSTATLDLTGVTGTYTLNTTTLTNRGTVAGGLIIGANALATGGGYYANVTVASGGTLTPGVGGNTNYAGNLTLNGGSTNLFQLGSFPNHDMSVVSNSLTYGGNNPLLTLDLTQWNSPVYGSKIVLYDNVFSTPLAGWDGTNQTFQLVDWGAGASSPVLLTNNVSFWAVGGGTTTNYFRINYAFAADLDAVGNDIALTVIPEPASVNLLVLLGAAYALRRRLHRPKRR